MKWCILDDFFPNLITGFRVAEFNTYLAATDQLTILSTFPGFERAHAEYAALYPQFADRVRPFTPIEVGRYHFVYVHFLNNIFNFLPIIENFSLPFAMTLYPGGGFGLNEPVSDMKLARVAASRCLRGIITTQRVTEEYLLQRYPQLPLYPIYVGVMNEVYFADAHVAATERRRRFGYDKDQIDICFIADKYMPQGVNKGYPGFVQAMTRVVAALPQARIHVVGGYGPEDFPVPIPPEQWQFHGYLYTAELRDFMLDMDLIVSPNLPFKLQPGNFDGFPTGSCVEASLCGAGMVVTDPLNLNQTYTDGEDILLVPPDPAVIAERIIDLAADPARLANLGRRGCVASRHAFAPREQLGRRIEVLTKAAAEMRVELGFQSA